MAQIISVLLLALWVATSNPAKAGEARTSLLVHTVLAAGLRHHDAKAIWEHLAVGDDVQLVREANNPHDPDAVRLEWNGFILGYLPREQNRTVARQLDRGADLRSRITALGRYRNHRLKLEVEIYLPL